MPPLPNGFGSMEEWLQYLEEKKEEIDSAWERWRVVVQINHPLYDPWRSLEEGRDVWRPLRDPFTYKNGLKWIDPYVPPGMEYMFARIPDFNRQPTSTSIHWNETPTKKKRIKMEKMTKKNSRLLLSSSLPGSPN